MLNFISEGFSVLVTAQFWGFVCVLISMYFLAKGIIKLMLVILSPLSFIISLVTWRYLCKKYRIEFPLFYEIGGQLQSSTISDGEAIPMRTAYASADGGDHASLTWIFLLTHNPFATIEVCCHEYGHLFMHHPHMFLFSNAEAWRNEREADTFALYAMKQMPILMKVFGILFRGGGLYWNPYSKKELSTAPVQKGSSGFRIQKVLWDTFGIDYRGVFKR